MFGLLPRGGFAGLVGRVLVREARATTASRLLRFISAVGLKAEPRTARAELAFFFAGLDLS